MAAKGSNPSADLPVFLSLKEVWRNRGRFLLFSMVIALITLLVLFIAALGEGLGNGNREYLSKLDAQLLVYSEKSDFLIAASRVDPTLSTSIRRVPGVENAGPLGTSSVNLVSRESGQTLKISLVGAEPGRPGLPPVISGQPLRASKANEMIIDANVAERSDIKVGDTVVVQSTQGTETEEYRLRVIGLTDSRQYSLAPTAFVPFQTWDKVRPKSQAEVNSNNPTANVIAVQVSNPAELAVVEARIFENIQNVETASIEKAIQNVPGYSAQQSTIQTQGVFTLFIGLLVIGGFFQIQVLQKVPQIGVLKAIGAPNPVIAAASVLQILIVTALGVAIGGLLTFLFSLSFPPTVPIVFNGQRTLLALGLLLLIGPVGGLVSIRYAVRIEPLKALGLSS